MDLLIFNPGGNSLKAEVVRCKPEQESVSQAVKLAAVIVEGIGQDAKLSRYRGKEIASSEAIRAQNYTQAAAAILEWFQDRAGEGIPALDRIDSAGIRVVHGGKRFVQPVEVTAKVEQEILELAKWAPLHNRHSVEVLPSIRNRLPKVPLYAVFDTAFHRTIPELAGLYAIPPELARKHEICRYGFHGISHRYMLGRYAHLAGRPLEQINLVTMHLESGCSVTAIERGRSVDNTMGLTPLEGLMMGTRSGDVDPSLLPFLIEAERMTLEEVMDLLNKRSGLLGVSGRSLDTRILMKTYQTDARVKLAMEMFSYRVRKAVGAYLAALGGAEAVVFGGGIAENTPLVRQRICEGLRWCGLEMDEAQNQALINVEGRLSAAGSSLHAYVIPVEEGLQIAHECSQALQRD